MNQRRLFYLLNLSVLLFYSVPARSDTLSKTFRALVNFGEPLVIESNYAGVRIRTSDQSLPIEMIVDPSAPLVTKMNMHAESVGFISEAALEKFKRLASKNIGFVLADVLSSSVTTCKRRRYPYGDEPYYFYETLSTLRFAIPIDNFPSIEMISTSKTMIIVDHCESADNY